jgi:hypothetical protein
MKKIIFVICILGLMAAFGIAIAWNIYPAAIVNDEIIWMRTIERMRGAARIYQEKTAAAARGAPPTIPAALDAAIQTILVRQAVRAQGAEPHAAARLAQALENAAKEPDFAIAISLLYGLDSAGFAEFILRPQAEKEVLMEKNGWAEERFQAWLAAQRTSARIVKFFE